MGSSGEVDLENQQTVNPDAIDRGGSWLNSLFNRIHSFCHQFLVKPSSTDDESEGVELTGATHFSPASPHDSGEVKLSLEVLEGDSITSTAPISDQVNVKGKDDITVRTTANEAKIQKIIQLMITTFHNKFGGILKGIAKALHPYFRHNEIPGNEQELLDPHNAVVTITQAPTPSFFKLLLQSCFNWTVFLLFVCAILSTVFGIQQEGPSNGWLEGAVGMLAISILVVVPTLIKYFSVPHTRSTSQMEIKVCRGDLLPVSPFDVVQGDIVYLEPGSLVPADGLFVPPGESLELEDGMKLPKVDGSNPSLVYGAKVVNGNGRMMVTSVGIKTTLGELMGQVRCTPNLQDQFPAQLDNLSTKLQNVGLMVAIVMTLVLIIRSAVKKENDYPGFQADQLKGKPTASKELIINVIGRFFMKSSGHISTLATYLPVLIVGLSEGVPFSVALANTYWTKATLSGKAIEQRNLTCFAMGFMSTICIGGEVTSNPVPEVEVSYDGNQIADTECLAEEHVREALYKGIAAPLMMPSSPCSSTEHQLLHLWAKSSLGLDNESLLQSCTTEESIKLSTDEEASRVLMKDNETGDVCLHRSGPAATILPMCTNFYDSNGTTKLMDEQKKLDFENSIRNMKSKNLKTIAFAHKRIDAPMPEEDKSLILIAVLGVKGGTEKMEAREVLRKAGVDIIDFPKDNESALPEGEKPIYGKGRPGDKLHTVQRLKDEGHVVAMVGNRTNETPAIKEADVGIAMGTYISEMAREGSDLIIHCGSLSFLVNIIRIGRCIYYNIQKCIQVELTTNISLLVTFLVTTISWGHCTIGAIEALWETTLVTVGALALLVEPPTEELMEKTPIKQTESVISKHMWRNILLQALYQASISVALQFKGKAIPGIDNKNMESIVFNSHVLCQVFNLVSSREPEKKNIFRGILRTPWLWLAVGISIIMQAAFIEIAHKVAGNARLDWGQWGGCLLVAMVSWLLDLAGKCVWGLIRKNRITIGSDIGSTSMSSAAASESASSRELLAST